MEIDLYYPRCNLSGFKGKCFLWIDENLRGWPSDYQHLGFEHTDERQMSFRINGANTGWWTQCYTRDEYLWWSLSEKFKRAVVRSVERGVVVSYNGGWPTDSDIEFYKGRL